MAVEQPTPEFARNISAHRDTVTLHPPTAALGQPHEPVAPFGQTFSFTHALDISARYFAASQG
jgi:hypothetical protein